MSDPNETAPDIEAFEAMASTAMDALPAAFSRNLGRLVVRVAEIAPPEVLRGLDIADPLELTGLYEGIPLTQQSALDLPDLPPTVWLYRQAILWEWAQRGDVALDYLVTHVLVHEIAHHFGYTDEQIAAIDDWRL